MPDDYNIKLGEAAQNRARIMTEDIGFITSFRAVGDDSHVEIWDNEGILVFDASNKDELNLRYLEWRDVFRMVYLMYLESSYD